MTAAYKDLFKSERKWAEFKSEILPNRWNALKKKVFSINKIKLVKKIDI